MFFPIQTSNSDLFSWLPLSRIPIGLSMYKVGPRVINGIITSLISRGLWPQLPIYKAKKNIRTETPLSNLSQMDGEHQEVILEKLEEVRYIICYIITWRMHGQIGFIYWGVRTFSMICANKKSVMHLAKLIEIFQQTGLSCTAEMYLCRLWFYPNIANEFFTQPMFF